MRIPYYFFVIGWFVFMGLQSCETANSKLDHDREKIIMRKIGHEILLSAHDSISLVRPIVYEDHQYRIQFESNFSFLPDDLISTIDTIIGKALPYNNYLVKVENCTTSEVVYSYEINDTSLLPDVACKTREQPEGCYEVIIEFIAIDKGSTSYLLVYTLLCITLILASVYIYQKNKKPATHQKIEIGAYLHDPKKMTLTFRESTVELTSKESELLELLYEHANNTVDRDLILKKVWGDEGNYVGRTLDVYISKLRKKLEKDSSIELRNIRGVGYKLILS